MRNVLISIIALAATAHSAHAGQNYYCDVWFPGCPDFVYAETEQAAYEGCERICLLDADEEDETLLERQDDDDDFESVNPGDEADVESYVWYCSRFNRGCTERVYAPNEDVARIGCRTQCSSVRPDEALLERQDDDDGPLQSVNPDDGPEFDNRIWYCRRFIRGCTKRVWAPSEDSARIGCKQECAGTRPTDPSADSIVATDDDGRSAEHASDAPSIDLLTAVSIITDAIRGEVTQIELFDAPGDDDDDHRREWVADIRTPDGRLLTLRVDSETGQLNGRSRRGRPGRLSLRSPRG